MTALQRKIPSLLLACLLALSAYGVSSSLVNPALAAENQIPDGLLYAVQQVEPGWPNTTGPMEAIEQKVGAPGQINEYFGSALALGDNMALVGAPNFDKDGNNDQGAVFFFTTYDGVTWSLQQRLYASDGGANDKFGNSIAITGNRAIIGASGDTIGANALQGSAYIFTYLAYSWNQTTKLTASDGSSGDQFGYRVALDPDRALIGAPGDDITANTDIGSAYIFNNNNGVWSEQARLSASDGASGDEFGYSVALFRDTALVGAPFHDLAHGEDHGCAYLFTHLGATWTQQAQLIASDAAPGDAFGFSTAISDGTAIIGAPFDTVDGQSSQGSAYVFTGSGTAWNEQAHLVASHGDAGDMFGMSVGVYGDTAAIGAMGFDLPNGYYAGAALVFSRSGTSWNEQAVLAADNPIYDDEFGSNIAIFNGTIIVGAPLKGYGEISKQGAAYIYSGSGSNWNLRASLLAGEGVTYDRFGEAVDIEGDTAVVGVPNLEVNGHFGQGAAYVFTRSGAAWLPQQKLIAGDGATDDCFGQAVAISGDSILIGAPGASVGSGTDQGAAYIFTRSGSLWSEQRKLSATGGGTNDQFGASVALERDSAVVGAYLHNVGAPNHKGSVYVFTGSGTEWTQQAQLTANDGQPEDLFGWTLAISGNTIVVGVPYADVNTVPDHGSAYVFTRNGTAWSQQASLTVPTEPGVGCLGGSVAILNDTLFLGAEWTEVDGVYSQGAGFVFTRSGTTWSQKARLTAFDAEEGGGFGASAAFDGNLLVVGARGPEAAYVFTRFGSAWFSLGKLIAYDGSYDDEYARSAAISGTRVLLGARNASIGSDGGEGAAYFYDLTIHMHQIFLPMTLRNP